MSNHRFKIGDFLCRENSPRLCGTVKQLFISGGHNKCPCYLVELPKTGNEKVIMDSQVKRVYFQFEGHDIMVEYGGEYIRATAPIEEILKIRPEVLQQ